MKLLRYILIILALLATGIDCNAETLKITTIIPLAIQVTGDKVGGVSSRTKEMLVCIKEDDKGNRTVVWTGRAGLHELVSRFHAVLILPCEKAGSEPLK